MYLEDLNLRRNEELGKLQREVLQKAQEYARAQKFDLLLADPNIIFASTRSRRYRGGARHPQAGGGTRSWQ